jgi:hypothetical protein
VADCVEKGGCCDAEGSVIQSVQLAELKIMMGYQQVEQTEMFYEFSLERYVPADHLLRSIDRFVDLGEIRRDRPLSTVVSVGLRSIQMIWMLMIGYLCVPKTLSGLMM